jgi:hypothetical protein
MYYGRRTVIRSVDLTDYRKLRAWVFSLSEHSMYEPILSDLIAMPGFVKKTSIIEDTPKGQVFINEVLFSSKETADVYFGYEGVETLWEWLKITADAEGFVIESDQRVEF